MNKYKATAVTPIEPDPVIEAYKDGVDRCSANGAEALAAWRKLPAAHTIERPGSIPGLDESTYIVTKIDERRNLFRMPLPGSSGTWFG